MTVGDWADIARAWASVPDACSAVGSLEMADELAMSPRNFRLCLKVCQRLNSLPPETARLDEDDREALRRITERSSRVCNYVDGMWKRR